MCDFIKKMLAGKPAPAPSPSPAPTPAPSLAPTRRSFYDPSLQSVLEACRPIYICFSLAGGTDPLLKPLIRFSPDYKKIILEKQGYDAWVHDLKGYYNGKVWEEREAALLRFMNKFFGEHMNSITVDARWIVDDLITFDSLAGYNSDFVMKWEYPLPETTPDERNHLREEIQQIPLFTPGNN